MRFRKIGLKIDKSETTFLLLSHDDKNESVILPGGTKILGLIWWISDTLILTYNVTMSHYQGRIYSVQKSAYKLGLLSTHCTKGQLISKSLFGIFNYSKKQTN